MRLVTLCFAFVVAGVSAAGLAPQARPNFSGVWVSTDASQATQTLTVKQDDSTLTIVDSLNSKLALNLDGSETTFPAPDGKPLVAKMVWKGNALVVTIHFPEVKQDIRRLTWTLDGTGQLTIETEFLGGKPRLSKEVFKRQ